jgi:omega-amidase
MRSILPSPSSIFRPPSSLLTIALAQMNVLTGQPDANLARVRDFAAQARDAGADLLLLPELWFNGYDLERAEERATPLGEGGFAHMARLAREFGLHLAGSLLERHTGGACGERRFADSRAGSGEPGRTVSNTAVLYAPNGTLLGFYRKIHRFRLMQEHRYLAPGDRATLCPTPWGPVGLAICYDLRFPELFRVMALAGAVLFLVPAQWPVRRVEAWLLLARARAAENELIVAACNRVGNDGQVTFPGRSVVVDPWGNVLVEGDDREGLLIAQADLREISKARRYLTVYEDRRPDAYRVEPATDGQHP